MFRVLAALVVLCSAATLVRAAFAEPNRPAAASLRKQPKARAKSPAALRAERLGFGTLKAAGQLLAGRPEHSWVRAAGPGDELPGTLRLPVVKGWFVRGFGSGKGGYHQAIDIGGEPGWNVRAAAAGIVAYAGSDVSGYGNLVMIVHPGGAVTAYGHNQKNLVVAGQRVDRGTVIALLGSTGRSKGPHVHFELLVRGQNCDPAPLFRPSLRRRNGKIAQLPRSTWKQVSKRPKTIRCHARKHHPGYVDKAEEEETEGADEAPANGSAGTAP